MFLPSNCTKSWTDVSLENDKSWSHFKNITKQKEKKRAYTTVKYKDTFTVYFATFATAARSNLRGRRSNWRTHTTKQYLQHCLSIYWVNDHNTGPGENPPPRPCPGLFCFFPPVYFSIFLKHTLKSVLFRSSSFVHLPIIHSIQH